MKSDYFGHYKSDLPITTEHLTLNIAPAAFPLRWNLCSLSANFMADYVSSVFRNVNGYEAELDHLRHMVSYVANELMENAFKYHHEATTGITISILKDSADFFLLVTNSVPPARLPGFYSFLNSLTDRDPAELYAERLEEALLEEAADDGSSQKKSGLGFITMMMIYDVKIGWKFDYHETDGLVILTTMVQIPIAKELSEHGNQN